MGSVKACTGVTEQVHSEGRKGYQNGENRDHGDPIAPFDLGTI